MTDWVRWHDDYDRPDSSLSRRLVVVREYTARALSAVPAGGSLISLCAGDGRDVLPLLPSHDVRAVLVELDPVLADRARAAAPAGVEVRTADAGDTSSFRDYAPAHVLMLCGVFGNIPANDMRRTVAALPGLLAPGGTVVWTRGRGDSGGPDPADEVRSVFAANGFEELAFTAPDDARFRVGLHRLGG